MVLRICQGFRLGGFCAGFALATQGVAQESIQPAAISTSHETDNYICWGSSPEEGLGVIIQLPKDVTAPSQHTFTLYKDGQVLVSTPSTLTEVKEGNGVRTYHFTMEVRSEALNGLQQFDWAQLRVREETTWHRTADLFLDMTNPPFEPSGESFECLPFEGRLPI